MPLRTRPLLRSWLPAIVCMVAFACTDEDTSTRTDPATPDGALPAVLVRPDLQELVEAGLDRRTAPLVKALADADADVRATASHALASVQDPAARPALEGLLGDPDPRVRRAATFALGQLGEGMDARALLESLESETDPEVRLLEMEAAGKGGDAAALRDLLAAVDADSPGDRPGLALALYHFGRRGVTDPSAGPVLVELLKGDDAERTSIAAQALAEPLRVDAWGITRDQVRRTLDDMDLDGPAAGPLLGILGRIGARGDAALLRDALRGAGDWRVRVAAARAVAAQPSAGEASEALVAALDDASVHVATAAAYALARSDGQGGPAPSILAAWIQEHPEWPSVGAQLLPALVGSPSEPLVLEWARGELGSGATPSLAYPALADIGSAAADSLLTEGLRGDRRQAYVAAAALAERVADLPSDNPLVATLVPLLTTRMDVWGPHAPMSDARGLLQLVAELAEARPDQADDLLAAASGHPHPEVRKLGERLSRGSSATELLPRREVDWARLTAAGARPRLRFQTDSGSFVVELHSEAAPLAVSQLLAWAESGAFDGLTFHRVEPDFILQSGDIQGPRGYGGPERGLRSEFTRIRYAPGVLGMASAGKDTEGSQYFITHGYSPSLDGRYGAVGRVVSGLPVAEAVALGDSVLSVTLLDGDTVDRPRTR